MNNKISFFLITLLALTFNSCTKNSRPLSELIEDNSEQQYLVQSGDTLSVNVWGEPKVSGEVFVREDGSFTMALIEDVKAVGLTPKQIAQSITTRLKKFIPSASVSVSVAQSSPIRYYLSGQFNKPGEYRSDKKISLLQAIATGGSFAPFADESEITLIRREASGEEMRYILDYNRIMDGKHPNPELKNGDFISVK
ncbi:MAG: polysaccharide biosynthesis/export family protein [Proteobacteria bacterium]|nr:polysaccharide biosynthesis/export family protein [Pseudomonadota bacterium]